MLNFLYRRSIKIGAIIALVFVFNIFGVVPSSLQHSADHGDSHVIAMAAEDLSQAPINAMHDHMESCGMMFCSINVANVQDVLLVRRASKIQFSGSLDQLVGLVHIPPVEPPKV